jgi:hypothetical protein
VRCVDQTGPSLVRMRLYCPGCDLQGNYVLDLEALGVD